MYYLELIDRFWKFNEKEKLGSTAIAMYLYLLKSAKDSDAYDFKVSDVVLSKQLGMTGKTVKIIKEKLRNLGLIQFQTKNGISGSYRLILNYSLEISVPEQIKNIELEVSTSFRELQNDLSLELFNVENDNPSGNVERNYEAPSTQLVDENIKIPELDEFLLYAQELPAYQSELYQLLKDKYHNWIDRGWKNASGRPITNWKSSLKSILPFLKNGSHDEQLSIQSIPDIKRPKSGLDN